MIAEISRFEGYQLVQLLNEEGIFTEQKFFTKFKQVQAQYQKHESIR